LRYRNIGRLLEEISFDYIIKETWLIFIIYMNVKICI
jgi:hypothetical protein